MIAGTAPDVISLQKRFNIKLVNYLIYNSNRMLSGDQLFQSGRYGQHLLLVIGLENRVFDYRNSITFTR